MSTSPDDRRAAARRNAQNAFSSSEQREVTFRKELEAERARSAAKTARLRALRLAKEAADREQAEKLDPHPQPTKKPRNRKMRRAPNS